MRSTILFKLYSEKLYLIFNRQIFLLKRVLEIYYILVEPGYYNMFASKDDSLLENHNISFNKIFLYLKFSINNFVATVSSNFSACQLSYYKY